MSAIPTTADDARDLLRALQERIGDAESKAQMALDSVFDLEDIVFGDDLDSTSADLVVKQQGSVFERLADLEEENEQLRERIEELETVAEQAMAVATIDEGPDGETKVSRARRLTRNELVRRAAVGGPSTDRPVTTRDVRDMGRPEIELKWQTIKDAWADLEAEWSCFRETTKNGEQALTVAKADIPKGLARLVESDLDRSDLTKRLVGENGPGGR